MDWNELLLAYLITFGWGLVGSLSMVLGLWLSLKVFTKLTGEVNEWKLIKEANVAMGLVLASVIIACGLAVSAAIRP